MQESKTDEEFIRHAIAESMESIDEDSRPHPKVGVVVVKEGNVLASAFRGEMPGSHAEYIALEKKLNGRDVSGATLFTTLEPCTTRNHPKIPCAQRIVERQIGRVIIGMLDPDPRIRGRGVWDLKKAGVVVGFFDNTNKKYEDEVLALNSKFIGQALEPRIKLSPFGISAIGDSYFERSKIPYRRISIVPIGELTEIIPPSSENDAWLDANRPNLVFGFPTPTEYGVAFEIPGHLTFAAVSRVGELYYGETRLESVGLDLGASIRLVGHMFRYAAAIYRRYPYRGRLIVEYRLVLNEPMELTLSEILERLSVLGNSKPIVSQGSKSVKSEIDTEALANLHGQVVPLVNDLLRTLGVSIPTSLVNALVKKYS
jgi:pyrimidine deaminase RibD-like protein